MDSARERRRDASKDEKDFHDWRTFREDVGVADAGAVIIFHSVQQDTLKTRSNIPTF